jgi:hypothetical protein
MQNLITDSLIHSTSSFSLPLSCPLLFLLHFLMSLMTIAVWASTRNVMHDPFVTQIIVSRNRRKGDMRWRWWDSLPGVQETDSYRTNEHREWSQESQVMKWHPFPLSSQVIFFDALQLLKELEDRADDVWENICLDRNISHFDDCRHYCSNVRQILMMKDIYSVSRNSWDKRRSS